MSAAQWAFQSPRPKESRDLESVRKERLKAIHAASGGGPFITRPKFAKLVNRRTNSVAKWDRQGKGPAGREAQSKTVVTYSTEGVIAWFRGRGLL